MSEPARMRDVVSTARMTFAPLGHDPATLEARLGGMTRTREAWLALAPSESFLHPDFQAIVLAAAAERPDVELWYADDAAPSSRDTPLQLKPCWNPALLQAQDYIGAPIVVRGSAFHRLGGLAPDAGAAAIYDLCLRAQAGGLVIDAIREVLLAHPGIRPLVPEADRRRALERVLDGSSRVLAGLSPDSLRVRRVPTDPPQTTLVVPTCQSPSRDGRPHICILLDSLAKSTWPHDRLSVLIGDDLEDDHAYGDLSRHPFAVRRVITRRPPDATFNYAAKMNALWRQASSEHMVLMNDDVEVQAPDWLEALATFSLRNDVGGVGARLLYADGSLQHAGMVGGLLGLFAHPWINQPADAATYGGWSLVQRDWSAVTGAVFATRRGALDAVGGFDEGYALEYNDVDLCLRMRLAGLRIVQAPDAVLVHHEKASRGERAPPGSQTAAFLSRWRQVILDDPAYHPGLTREGVVVHPEPVWGSWYAGIPPT